MIRVYQCPHCGNDKWRIVLCPAVHPICVGCHRETEIHCASPEELKRLEAEDEARARLAYTQTAVTCFCAALRAIHAGDFHCAAAELHYAWAYAQWLP